jgi:hypothetical protein
MVHAVPVRGVIFPPLLPDTDPDQHGSACGMDPDSTGSMNWDFGDTDPGPERPNFMF